MRKRYSLLIGIVIPLVFLLGACGGVTVQQAAPQQTVTISKTFQSNLSPLPTVPAYRCGAWASDNAPNPYATITIYARLTKDIIGVGGATATATVHFNNGDATLDTHPVSDNGGYVTFTLALQGRQPANIPATVDVTFTNFPGGKVNCTQAFFTPQ